MITIYHGELHNALEGLDVTKINSAYGTRSCRNLTQDNNHLDCGECNVCAAYCDVCGVWYSLDEPCEFH